jgi:choline dehydrogenase
MNYLSTERDQEVAIEAIQITRDIVSHLDPKFKPKERSPGIGFQTKEELVKAAGAIGTTIFHPVGTCKMGLPDDPSAVVNSELRVNGIRNLRIADCSVMPTIVSGNTAAPAMMIGAKCGQMILREEE